MHSDENEQKMILDHISLSVSDYAASKAFFTAALKPLGIALVMEVGGWAGFGRKERPQFWFGAGDGAQKPMHIAFAAENRAQVRAFHEAALQAGAKDNGPPGVREIYHPNYYGAFVIGPDGHNVEAVCHAPET
jgi:catechol 2,3-dioxygenase-like lactoylglutathione lyase family enzyme